MSIAQTMDLIKHDFLRAVYELAQNRAKLAISFSDAQLKSGHSEEDVDRASDFWADRGVLEFPIPGHIALTHIGLRRAQRLADRGWHPQIPF
jgi:hypothetical protein